MKLNQENQQFDSDEPGYGTTLTIVGDRNTYPCLKLERKDSEKVASESPPWLFFDLGTPPKAEVARKIAKALVHLANRIERRQVALRPSPPRTPYAKAVEKKKS